jgi:hypothetical protein
MGSARDVRENWQLNRERRPAVSVYGSDSCCAPAAGVDAQLASIDAAPPPPGATSWRELTARNADRLLA